MTTGIKYRRGLIAVAPCSIAECSACNCGLPNCVCGALNYVIDHCHTHGYVRGSVCVRCNREMGKVDKILAGGIAGVLLVAPVKSYIAHWNNCPECIDVANKCKCIHITGRNCGCDCLICKNGR